MEHQKTHEPEKLSESSADERLTDSITPDTEDKTKKRSSFKGHVCQFCGRGFPSVSLLTTHIRVSDYPLEVNLDF